MCTESRWTQHLSYTPCPRLPSPLLSLTFCSHTLHTHELCAVGALAENRKITLVQEEVLMNAIAVVLRGGLLPPFTFLESCRDVSHVLHAKCTLTRSFMYDCCHIHLTGDTCSLTAPGLLEQQGEVWLKEAYRAAQRTRWQTSKDFQAALEAQLLQVCDSSPCTDNGESSQEIFSPKGC